MASGSNCGAGARRQCPAPARLAVLYSRRLIRNAANHRHRLSAAMPTPTVALARELIRRESITPTDAGCQALLRARLEAIGFACETMNFEDVSNLWALHRGGGDGEPLVVFAGHTDVVPTGPREQWRLPPFAGEIDGGYLHGRGAADMKGGVAAFVTACERFAARHPQHRGRVGLLITSDEEGVALHGTRAVMDALNARGERIDMCVVGEPSSADALGDTIKVGRRGTLGAALRVGGKQGHIAYPGDNPIHRTVRILAELTGIEWDRGNANFPPTSFQVSNIRAGTGATNVIPGHAEVQFNLRYSPEITEAEIRARVERVLAHHEADYAIEWHAGGLPFETVRGELVEVAVHCIEAVTGRRPAKSTAGGTSDGRFIAATGAQVVEVGPVNATIHQIDECVSTADLDDLSVIYEKMLERLLT